MFLISGCLIGINCKYNGSNNKNREVVELVKKGLAVPFCPEQLGGLPTPRYASEIQQGSGEDVLEGRARVINQIGQDVTENFKRGAEEALKLAKILGTKFAILKSKSPSCGYGKIYDGSFSGVLVNGNGVTAALFLKNGIKVITEKDEIKKSLSFN
ncbi:hypothetical protein H0A61_02346 [Koleobacter methoxysyntrophicus]|jgi:uncharacterized protein YbbK (DUF523 family)|uniref:DUF523 domain-containing protein n=1 Tax=Koleobacter methoxysyntrophicus TaxID=2751313 RepID=A0A8A0RQX3_9FIRM|nr:DUF523 domain-containing protein [Koleobacter methoxysyntrophicus]MDI3540465.1 hypothetical protein [Thermosediminibacterales bacterium]QSQ09960.1 hypothetical protein H0A61_02346 [Koleobacter methoxysyntrophicus]